jgi:hypothetical protein
MSKTRKLRGVVALSAASLAVVASAVPAAASGHEVCGICEGVPPPSRAVLEGLMLKITPVAYGGLTVAQVEPLDRGRADPLPR